MSRKSNRISRVAVIDLETDPFLFGRVPSPFAAGFRWGDIYVDFWGDDCVAQLIAYLSGIDTPLTIYAHNGGKFDFMFLMEHISNPIKVIHGRLARAKLGIHELRDSWLINPQPLSKYKKDEIDYRLFERDRREKHREEILHYLRGDCEYLHDICIGFVERFGMKLTMPGAAMTALSKLHPQQRGGKNHDKKFRPFYFGGRVECFQKGILLGDWQVFDVNSMYPHCMRDWDHPAGLQYVHMTRPRMHPLGWIEGYIGSMYFAQIRCHSRGALPVRSPHNKGLSFPVGYGTFDTTSHEIRMGIALGKITEVEIIDAWVPIKRQRFSGFVDAFMLDKLAAEAAGDAIGRLFSKLVLNSGYGKFGQDPDDFREYWLERKGIDGRPPPIKGKHYLDDWEPYQSNDAFMMWRSKKRPDNEDNDKRGYFDVAIAASVTSAARAILMHAISASKNIAYCDTDSVICEEIDGVHMDAKALGAWKTEASGNELAIVGKKLYCLSQSGEPVKYASKGLKFTPDEIRKAANGMHVTWDSMAPSFNLLGDAKFISRNVNTPQSKRARIGSLGNRA